MANPIFVAISQNLGRDSIAVTDSWLQAQEPSVAGSVSAARAAVAWFFMRKAARGPEAG